MKKFLLKYLKSPFWGTINHAKDYFFAALATKALGFISIPVLTRLLSTEDYGILNVFNAYSSVIVVLFTLNLHVSISRYYYEDKQDFHFFVGLSCGLAFLSCIITFIPFLLFRHFFANLMHLPVNMIFLFLPLTVNNVFRSIYDQIKGSKLETKELGVLSVVIAYVSFGFTVFLIYRFDTAKYLCPIYSNIIIGCMTTIFIFFRIRKYIRFSIKTEHIKYILHYSIPYIPYSLSGIILTAADRIMINSGFGASTAGLYAFAVNIGMLLNFFTNALNSAWLPKYFKYMNKQLYSQHDRDVERLMRIVLVFAFLLVAFSQELGMLFSGEAFHSSFHIIPLIVIGYVFDFMTSIYQHNIGFAKKTFFLALSVLSAGILNIGLNALFLKRFGYNFGAISTVISYVFLLFLTWFIAKFVIRLHTFKLSILFRYLLSFGVFVCFLGGVKYLFDNMIMLFFIKCCLTLVLCFFFFKRKYLIT